MTTVQLPIVRSRVEDLYDNLLSSTPDHWYAVLEPEDELIHSDDATAVANELRRRGYEVGEVLIARAPGPGPYLVL